MTSQYRCETCNHVGKDIGKDFGIPLSGPYFKDCPLFSRLNECPKLSEAKIPCNVLPEITAIVGCASHSDFKQEREKVLDETIKIISDRIQELKTQRKEDMGIELYVTHALIGENQAMWAQLKELRGVR